MKLIKYEDCLFIHVLEQGTGRGDSVFDIISKTLKYDLKTNELIILSETEFFYVDLVKKIIYPDNDYNGINIYDLKNNQIEYVLLDEKVESCKFTMIDDRTLVYRLTTRTGVTSAFSAEGYIKLYNIDTGLYKSIRKTSFYVSVGDYLDVYKIAN